MAPNYNLYKTLFLKFEKKNSNNSCIQKLDYNLPIFLALVVDSEDKWQINPKSS